MENILLNKIATSEESILPFDASKAVSESGITAKWVKDIVNEKFFIHHEDSRFNELTGITEEQVNQAKRWVAKTVPASLTVDLGEVRYASRWVVTHLGAIGWDYSYNMQEYTLETSIDGKKWVEVDKVEKNSGYKTDRNFGLLKARYFRLKITKGARINPNLAGVTSFEVFEAGLPNELDNLTLSKGMLKPPFDSKIRNYSSAVDYVVDKIQVTPVAADALATITVNGAAVLNNTISKPIDLKVGLNTITVVVTPPSQTENGKLQLLDQTETVLKPVTYTITITRHSSAYLVSPGIRLKKTATTYYPAATPPFSRTKFGVYSATISAGSSVTIVLSQEDAAASAIIIQDRNILSGHSVTIHSGENRIEIKVTSTSGDIKVYTLIINGL